MSVSNPGYEPQVINDYRDKMTKDNRNHIIVDSEENSDEYQNFYFIGAHEGREVVYDAAIYTLRLHHNSEMYEIAEDRAAERFPEFKKIKNEEDEENEQLPEELEEEIGLYMAEVMAELEDEGEIRVSEYLEIDPYVDFGVGIDAALNVEKVTSDVITKFVNGFNEGTLQLDKTLYTFHLEEEDEDIS